MSKRPLPYRYLRRVLRSYGIAEEKPRDNDAKRVFVGIIDGKFVRQPIDCRIESEEIPVSIVEVIRRAFDLKNAEITDEVFYGTKRR